MLITKFFKHPRLHALGLYLAALSFLVCLVFGEEIEMLLVDVIVRVMQKLFSFGPFLKFCVLFFCYICYLFVSVVILKRKDRYSSYSEFTGLWRNPNFFWNLILQYARDPLSIVVFVVLLPICIVPALLFSLLLLGWTLVFGYWYFQWTRTNRKDDFRIKREIERSLIPSVRTLVLVTIWDHSQKWGFVYAYNIAKRIHGSSSKLDVSLLVLMRLFTLLIGYSFNYLKGISCITSAIVGTVRSPTLSRKKRSPSLYWSILLNSFMHVFDDCYGDIFYTAGEMRIYIDARGEVTFNPPKSVKVNPKVLKCVVMREGGSEHAAIGRGTGDTIVGVTSHPKRSMRTLPLYTRGRNSCAITNAFYQNSAIRSVRSDDIHIARIHRNTGLDHPLYRRITSREVEMIKFGMRTSEILNISLNEIEVISLFQSKLYRQGKRKRLLNLLTDLNWSIHFGKTQAINSDSDLN